MDNAESEYSYTVDFHEETTEAGNGILDEKLLNQFQSIDLEMKAKVTKAAYEWTEVVTNSTKPATPLRKPIVLADLANELIEVLK